MSLRGGIAIRRHPCWRDWLDDKEPASELIASQPAFATNTTRCRRRVHHLQILQLAERKTMASSEGVKELTDVMDQLVENTDGENITLSDLFDALESRSYGPLLLIIALVSVSPIGGLPGMSLITGALILILCSQMLVGRTQPWLPKMLLSFRFKRRRLEQTVDGGRPWAEWLERALHHRMAVLTKGPALIAVALICILLAGTFFPLAVVPFGVFVPGVAISMLALGITARDGLLVLLGLFGAAAALVLLVVCWPS